MHNPYKTPHARFFEMLNYVPEKVAKLWDPKRGLDTVAMEEGLAVWSSGEVYMTKFLVSIWVWDNRYEFDIFSFWNGLDGQYRKVIMDWLADPFYP